jgi:glycogen debranching enzyme
MRVTAREPQPISMEAAVGYPNLDHLKEESIEGRLVLKHDRLFLLTNSNGDIAPAGGAALGLFLEDTRILSHYELRLAGGPAALLSSQLPEQYLAHIDLAVSDRAFGGVAWDPKNVVHLRREILLDDGLTERITLTSFHTQPLDYTLSLRIGCDFADIFEVRGWKRSGRGQFYEPRVGASSIVCQYRDRSGRLLGTEINFAEPPTEVHGAGAEWRFQLLPKKGRVLEWRIIPGGGHAAPCDVRVRREPLRRMYEEWRKECTHYESDVEEFNDTLRHATDDLRALYTEADGEPVISAGIPWYSTVFGRDSIITSLQTLSLNPRVAADTLRYLARYQGQAHDDYTEEQPGRIMHELRRGELARTGETPHTPYYGTVDATPLFVVLLHEYWRFTGDDALARELLPCAQRALQWIDQHGDVDGDGFVEYARTSDKGLVNQGWKDSGDGVPFPDGSLPGPPVALVEVQGYVMDAKTRMAFLLDAFGEHEQAAALRAQAETLRGRISEAFWQPDLRYFALALDGRKRALPTVTSNAAHLLWSRAVTPEQASVVAEQLLAPDMFSGWGIRTLSARHPVYNPMSYHNGSIWPHDNAIAVMGLAHYGLAERAQPVLSALHEAALNMRLHRMPELFCGMSRAQGVRPVLYPVSCSPQAWASGAFFMLLQSVLGILPDAPRRVLRIREPTLPSFLHRLVITGLRVGASSVGLEFRRHGNRTLANLLGVDGEPLRVVMELA